MTILRREKATSAQTPQSMKITSLRGGNYCVRPMEKLASEEEEGRIGVAEVGFQESVYCPEGGCIDGSFSSGVVRHGWLGVQ
jgi:hypothetical protein